MPLPTASSIIEHILRLICDGEPWDTLEVKRSVIKAFEISKAEQAQYLPSGREPVLSNRLRNANFRMRREGLAVFSGKQHTVQITEAGKRLASRPARAPRITEVYVESIETSELKRRQ